MIDRQGASYPLHSKDKGIQWLDPDEPGLREAIQDLWQPGKLERQIATDTDSLKWVMQKSLPLRSLKAIVVVPKTVLHDNIFGKSHIAPINCQWSPGLPVFLDFGDEDTELPTNNALKTYNPISREERIQGVASYSMDPIRSRAQDGVLVAEAGGQPVVFVDPSCPGKYGIPEIRVQDMDLVWGDPNNRAYGVRIERLGPRIVLTDFLDGLMYAPYFLCKSCI